MLYPIMSESRSVMDLSGIWDFRLDNGDGFAEKWYERSGITADMYFTRRGFHFRNLFSDISVSFCAVKRSPISQRSI